LRTLYFKIIGEFGYLKMVVTLLLQTMNEQCLDILEHPVCKGPINSEMRNIDYARCAFQTNKSFASLCKAFILVNSMTLICWPVGQHNDHFSKNVESLENKILFVVPSENRNNGRGGSLIGSQFVFALLDWRSKLVKKKDFMSHMLLISGLDHLKISMHNVI
jgi:hypothetical protein